MINEVIACTASLSPTRGYEMMTNNKRLSIFFLITQIHKGPDYCVVLVPTKKSGAILPYHMSRQRLTSFLGKNSLIVVSQLSWKRWIAYHYLCFIPMLASALTWIMDSSLALIMNRDVANCGDNYPSWSSFLLFSALVQTFDSELESRSLVELAPVGRLAQYQL